MARITKKQHRLNVAAWRASISEGRVIRYTSWDEVLKCNQYRFVAYPTKEQTDKTLQVQQTRITAGESVYTKAEIATEEGNPQK